MKIFNRNFMYKPIFLLYALFVLSCGQKPLHDNALEAALASKDDRIADVIILLYDHEVQFRFTQIYRI